MVTLPETTWGLPGGRRALLLHGIVGAGINWQRVGEALAAEGWHVTAVDLRGHGTAPRATSYTIADYVSDLPGSEWDLVLGHSLGGAIAVVAASRPGFARRLALLDPVLEIRDEVHDAIGQEQLDEVGETVEAVRAARPSWHPLDVEAKARAASLADPTAIAATFAQNRPWLVDVPASVPTLVVAGPMFTSLDGAEIVTIDGTGHSPHRDDLDAVMTALREFYQRA